MGPLHTDPTLKTGLLMYFPRPAASKALARDKNVMCCTYHCSLCKELYSDMVSIYTFRVLGTKKHSVFHVFTIPRRSSRLYPFDSRED
jgi:hypothetical protein